MMNKMKRTSLFKAKYQPLFFAFGVMIFFASAGAATLDSGDAPAAKRLCLAGDRGCMGSDAEATPMGISNLQTDAVSSSIFMLPQCRVPTSIYDRGMCYIDQDFKIVNVLVKSRRTSQLDYAIVQRTSCLKGLSPERQLMQEWCVTYPNKFSWKLEVLVEKKGLYFNWPGKEGRESSLTVDGSGALLHTMHDDVTQKADNVTHLYYDHARQGFFFAVNSGTSIPVDWYAREDRIVLCCNDSEIDTFFDKKRGTGKMHYDVKSFLKSLVPTLHHCKEPTIDLNGERKITDVVYSPRGRSQQSWSVRYCMRRKFGVIKLFCQSKLKHSFSFNYFLDSSKKRLVRIFMQDFDASLRFFDNECAQVSLVTSDTDTELLTACTTLAPARCFLPYYSRTGISGCILTDDGYMLLADAGQGWEQIALSAIHYSPDVTVSLANLSLTLENAKVALVQTPKPKRGDQAYNDSQKTIYCKNKDQESIASITAFPNSLRVNQLDFCFNVGETVLHQFSLHCRNKKNEAVWISYGINPVSTLTFPMDDDLRSPNCFSTFIEADPTLLQENKLAVTLQGKKVIEIKFLYDEVSSGRYSVGWQCVRTKADCYSRVFVTKTVY